MEFFDILPTRLRPYHTSHMDPALQSQPPSISNCNIVHPRSQHMDRSQIPPPPPAAASSSESKFWPPVYGTQPRAGWPIHSQLREKRKFDGWIDLEMVKGNMNMFCQGVGSDKSVESALQRSTSTPASTSSSSSSSSGGGGGDSTTGEEMDKVHDRGNEKPQCAEGEGGKMYPRGG